MAGGGFEVPTARGGAPVGKPNHNGTILPATEPREAHPHRVATQGHRRGAPPPGASTLTSTSVTTPSPRPAANRSSNSGAIHRTCDAQPGSLTATTNVVSRSRTGRTWAAIWSPTMASQSSNRLPSVAGAGAPNDRNTRARPVSTPTGSPPDPGSGSQGMTPVNHADDPARPTSAVTGHWVVTMVPFVTRTICPGWMPRGRPPAVVRSV